MERMSGEVDGGQLRVGNLDAFGIFVYIQFSVHFEAGIGCRRGDQLDDRAITAQRFAAPVDRDKRTETPAQLESCCDATLSDSSL